MTVVKFEHKVHCYRKNLNIPVKCRPKHLQLLQKGENPFAPRQVSACVLTIDWNSKNKQKKKIKNLKKTDRNKCSLPATAIATATIHALNGKN